MNPNKVKLKSFSELNAIIWLTDIDSIEWEKMNAFKNLLLVQFSRHQVDFVVDVVYIFQTKTELMNAHKSETKKCIKQQVAILYCINSGSNSSSSINIISIAKQCSASESYNLRLKRHWVRRGAVQRQPPCKTVFFTLL